MANPLAQSLPAQRSGQKKKKKNLEEGDDEKRAGPKRLKMGDDVKETKQEAAPEEADEEVEDDEAAEEEKTTVQAVKRRISQGYKRKPGKEPDNGPAERAAEQSQAMLQTAEVHGEAAVAGRGVVRSAACDLGQEARGGSPHSASSVGPEQLRRAANRGEGEKRAAGIGLGIDRSSNEKDKKDEKDEKDERPRRQAIILDTPVCRSSKLSSIVHHEHQYGTPAKEGTRCAKSK